MNTSKTLLKRQASDALLNASAEYMDLLQGYYMIYSIESFERKKLEILDDVISAANCCKWLEHQKS